MAAVTEIQRVSQIFTKTRYFSSGSRTKLPVLTFFTKRKEECSLCEIAKEEIMPLKSKFTYEEVYIDDKENKKDWFEKYQYDIPVIHIDGKFAMKHRVNRAQLEEMLELTRKYPD